MKKIPLILALIISFISCEDNNEAAEKTMIIASQKVDCVGVAPQQCLLIKANENQNWEYLYDSIINFNYEEGFEYEVLVLEEQVENPAQDASSIKYTLIKVISKIEKTSENIPV